MKGRKDERKEAELMTITVGEAQDKLQELIQAIEGGGLNYGSVDGL